MTVVHGPAGVEECEDNDCTGCRWCEPRRSPKPCSDDCPGWAVFDAGDDLEIERCDDCWHGVPDAPSDAYFAGFDTCQAALEAAWRSLIERTPQ